MEYTDTTSSLARQAAVAAPTVRAYADLGLLDFKRLANGIRLFRAGQAEKVRQIYADRVARRGRRSA